MLLLKKKFRTKKAITFKLKINLNFLGVSQSVIDAQNEMYLIDNDMSLSMLEAQDRKRAVYGNLTFAERRQFHG